MKELITLVIIGLQVEAVWETLKMVWQNGKVSVDKIGALVIGILLSVGTGVGINELIGIELSLPLLDILLTGILISRGSNFIHDFIMQLDKKRNE